MLAGTSDHTRCSSAFDADCTYLSNRLLLFGNNISKNKNMLSKTLCEERAYYLATMGFINVLC